MEGQCFVPLDTSFTFASSPDVPLTPTSSPRSEWMESGPLEFNHHYNNAYFWINTTFPSASLMSDTVSPETGDLPYQQVHQQPASMNYQHMPHTNTVDIALVTPTSPFTMPSAPGTCDSYFDVGMMPSPQALSRLGSITSMSSWSCSIDSPSSDLSERRHSDVSNCLDPDPYASPLHSSRSICEMKSPPVRRNLSKENPVSLQRMVPKPREQPFSALPVGTRIIKKATSECDYPGCNKAFRRIEHLKRHKQAKHGEGENNYACEFCGKDKFNSIKFVPAAVAVIEEEDLTRKRRVTFRSRR
ncbi:zinc finger odd-paired-like (opl) [Fusarium acutatum]|uniref:Zinc finger odd-paired-like (Opl) n=1 Tax=Fusarium acutatum TaxID=78861 RepID=A0A8H4JHX0_9HYPO|nr:zinc finger odd-paired-like (opl) [Fusarium acutatum]